MKPEEFERIKQAEKEHLRKIKKLKEAHRQLERQKRMTEAVTDMTSSMQEKLDIHSDMMDKIGTEAALNEARLEMALESQERAEQEAQALKDEQDLTKAKAKDLVRQMKSIADAEHDEIPAGSPSSVESASDSPSSPEDSEEPSSEENLPEKTIGRMKP